MGFSIHPSPSRDTDPYHRPLAPTRPPPSLGHLPSFTRPPDCSALMKSPSLLSSPKLGSISVFSLICATQLARAAPTGPPPPAPLYANSPPSLSASPTLTNTPPTPFSSPPPSPVIRSVDGPSQGGLSGLGITVPLSKKASYLAKRDSDVVDYRWLLDSKANVLRKFGGSLNPASPLFGSPLAGGDWSGDGDDDDTDPADEEATETSAGPTPSEGASVAGGDSSADVHVQLQPGTLVSTAVVPTSVPSVAISRRQSGNALTDEVCIFRRLLPQPSLS